MRGASAIDFESLMRFYEEVKASGPRVRQISVGSEAYEMIGKENLHIPPSEDVLSHTLFGIYFVVDSSLPPRRMECRDKDGRVVFAVDLQEEEEAGVDE